MVKKNIIYTSIIQNHNFISIRNFDSDVLSTNSSCLIRLEMTIHQSVDPKRLLSKYVFVRLRMAVFLQVLENRLNLYVYDIFTGHKIRIPQGVILNKLIINVKTANSF